MNEILLALLLAISSRPALTSSECAVAKTAEHTYWTHMYLVDEYPEPLPFLHGIVKAAGAEDTTLDGVLVEVFDHPEIALQTHGSQTGKRQKRLGACITGKDGRFSFDPKAGKYELRFSRYDCNVKAVIVEVSKKAHNKTRIEVILEAAT